MNETIAFLGKRRVITSYEKEILIEQNPVEKFTRQGSTNTRSVAIKTAELVRMRRIYACLNLMSIVFFKIRVNFSIIKTACKERLISYNY